MKQYWKKIALKIDGMSLRERGMVFAAATALLIMIVNAALLGPQFARQKQLSMQLKQEQAEIAKLQGEIQERANARKFDPDAANLARLLDLKQQFETINGKLMEVQKGLVSPDKMGSLLEDILKRNGKLRLLSLKTMPVSNLSEAAALSNKGSPEKADPAKAPLKVLADAPAKLKIERPRPLDSVYRHGVEIVVQGGYLDMVDYLAELESMPWQLFWGKARLSVDEYPKATLSLTLFTLSLDKKWLNL